MLWGVFKGVIASKELFFFWNIRCKHFLTKAGHVVELPEGFTEDLSFLYTQPPGFVIIQLKP